MREMVLTATDKEFLKPETEEVVNPATNESAPESRWRSFVFIPLIFLYMFSNNIISTPLTDLIMNRVCLHNLNYSADVCSNLTYYSDIEDKVQIRTTNINLYSSMIKVFPSACLSVFVGPWSDKYGRKPPMYVSIIGFMLYDIGIILYGYFPNAPVYIVYLASIPNGLTGSAVAFLGCCYSLASDSSDYRLRTRNFALMQAAVGLGAPLGGLVAGYLTKVGYVPVFGLGLATHFATMLFLFFAIKDGSVRKKASAKTKIVEFFSLDNLKENLRVLLKKRENKGTAQLVLVTISSAIIYLNYTSIFEVMFPFCKKMYNWTVAEYSMVIMVYAVSSMAILGVAIPVLLRVLKVPDAWLGAIGSFLFIVEHVIEAFAYYPWLFYISLAVSAMSGLAPFASRARISKTVQDDEQGCVFAAVSTLENVIPLIGGPLFTGVYNGSISFFPGLVFLVAGATIVFPFIVFMWLTRYPSQLPQKMETDNEEGETSKSADQEAEPAKLTTVQ